jgi:hypothetical protein
MQLEPWQVPLDAPANAVGSGRLTLHDVQVGAGPLVRQLAAALGIGDRVQLAEDAVVTFQMQDGRVYHEGLEFGLPGYRIRTSGWVGLDESLELMAEMPMPLPRDLPEDRPLLRALSGQTLRFPIVGTLEKPELDARVFGRSMLDLVRSTVNEISGDRSPENERAADGGTAGEAALPEDPTLEEILDLTGDLMEQLPIGEGQLLERLQQRQPLLRRRDRGMEDQPPPGTPPPRRDRLFPRRQPPREF